MIDIDHPQAQYTIEAGLIETVIHRHVLAWRRSSDVLPVSALEQIQQAIQDLHTLNAEHYGASAKIAAGLDAILCAVVSGDAELSWETFVGFIRPRGDNFGTWAI